MIDDLRPVVADILVGLAIGRTRRWDLGLIGPDEHYRRMRLLDGAEILRWVHRRETEASDDEVAELERLRELVEGIEGILEHTAVGPRGGRAHPATTLKAITEAMAGQS